MRNKSTRHCSCHQGLSSGGADVLAADPSFPVQCAISRQATPVQSYGRACVEVDFARAELERLESVRARTCGIHGPRPSDVSLGRGGSDFEGDVLGGVPAGGRLNLSSLRAALRAGYLSRVSNPNRVSLSTRVRSSTPLFAGGGPRQIPRDLPFVFGTGAAGGRSDPESVLRAAVDPTGSVPKPPPVEHRITCTDDKIDVLREAMDMAYRYSLWWCMMMQYINDAPSAREECLWSSGAQEGLGCKNFAPGYYFGNWSRYQFINYALPAAVAIYDAFYNRTAEFTCVDVEGVCEGNAAYYSSGLITICDSYRWFVPWRLAEAIVHEMAHHVGVFSSQAADGHGQPSAECPRYPETCQQVRAWAQYCPGHTYYEAHCYASAVVGFGRSVEKDGLTWPVPGWCSGGGAPQPPKGIDCGWNALLGQPECYAPTPGRGDDP